MDPLSDFLDGPRARGAFLLRVQMSPPWGIQVADEAPLTVVQVVRGTCWFRSDDTVQRLRPGETLLVRATAAYLLTSRRSAEPMIRIGPAQECTGGDGRDLSGELAGGVRTWGNDPDGDGDCLLVGTYRSAGEVGRLLLSALPEALVVTQPAPEVTAMLDRELGSSAPGQSSMLDRLLDMLLITSVRQWAQESDGVPNLVRGGRDASVRQAVALLQTHPDRPWSVQALAQEVGVSRAALSRRFVDALGVPPMGYLAQWRLAIAADLLADPELTLAAVARRVGYATPFSLSSAFKKHYGVSPQQYRRRSSA